MNLQEKFIKKRKIMDELFNVEVIGTSRNKIDNAFFYFKTSKEDCNGWHYLAIELDAEKKL